MKHSKIVLVGAGAVGTSFVYAAVNQGLAQEYGIIDVMPSVAEGQAMDIEDAMAALPYPAVSIKAGGYELVKDADILVITAGRPQKPEETRLQMVEDNAKIMASIADQVKAHGFNGITVIASNPVDVMTAVYQHRTGFDPKKVISSSCTLDTSRLRVELSKYFHVSPLSIGAYVIGEHGDSSVSTFSHATLNSVPITKEMYEKVGLTSEKLKEMHTRVYRRAYEIIARKRATHYGVGVTLANVCRTILRDERRIITTGALLTGQYGHKGVYCGTPCVVGRNGIEQVLEFPLSHDEKAALDKSIQILTDVTAQAIKATSK